MICPVFAGLHLSPFPLNVSQWRQLKCDSFSFNKCCFSLQGWTHGILIIGERPTDSSLFWCVSDVAWCTWQPRNTGPEITKISSTTDENHKFEGIYAPINQVHDFPFTLSWFLGLDILEEPVELALKYWKVTIYRASFSESMHLSSFLTIGQPRIIVKMCMKNYIMLFLACFVTLSKLNIQSVVLIAHSVLLMNLEKILRWLFYVLYRENVVQWVALKD